MQMPTTVVENKIKNLVFEIFAVVFNGWVKEDTHYIGIFATYAATDCLRLSKHLLWISSIASKDTFNGAEHYDYGSYVSIVHENTFTIVVALIDYNTARNKASARWDDPFLCLYSHHYNLKMNNILFATQRSQIGYHRDEKTQLPDSSCQTPPTYASRHTNCKQNTMILYLLHDKKIWHYKISHKICGQRLLNAYLTKVTIFWLLNS